MTMEERAEQFAGNWQQAHCFSWPSAPDPENFGMWYFESRDSDLLEEANASVIKEAMKDLEGAEYQQHSHWAVGWVGGYVIQIKNEKGEYTSAFQKYCELKDKLEDYPILDSHVYDQFVDEQTEKNIPDAAFWIKDLYSLPEGWESATYLWLLDNDSDSLENRDDQGGYPKEEEILNAWKALGYQEITPHPFRYLCWHNTDNKACGIRHKSKETQKRHEKTLPRSKDGRGSWQMKRVAR